MTGLIGEIRLITWRGEDLALVSLDHDSPSTAQVVTSARAWTEGVAAGVVVLPHGWTVLDERERP
jgi:hypothetical protein